MKSRFSKSGQVFPQFWVFEAIFEARGENVPHEPQKSSQKPEIAEKLDLIGKKGFSFRH